LGVYKEVLADLQQRLNESLSNSKFSVGGKEDMEKIIKSHRKEMMDMNKKNLGYANSKELVREGKLSAKSADTLA
jgi:hypothetical protein